MLSTGLVEENNDRGGRYRPLSLQILKFGLVNFHFSELAFPPQRVYKNCHSRDFQLQQSFLVKISNRKRQSHVPGGASL